MTVQPEMSEDGRVLTVSLPLSIRKRGGTQAGRGARRGPSWARSRVSVDSTLMKAIARAHRWQRMLESGHYGSVGELAAAERINPSYLARVLRLTLLAPELVESVLEGRSREAITLERLTQPFPIDWNAQRF